MLSQVGLIAPIYEGSNMYAITGEGLEYPTQCLEFSCRGHLRFRDGVSAADPGARYGAVPRRRALLVHVS